LSFTEPLSPASRRSCPSCSCHAAALAGSVGTMTVRAGASPSNPSRRISSLSPSSSSSEGTSTMNPFALRMRPPRTRKRWAAATRESDASPKMSTSISSDSTIVLPWRIVLMASRRSRSLAARSNSRSRAASSMLWCKTVVTSPSLPAINDASDNARALCSAGLTRPTHGAAHFPISPSRHGRPCCTAL